MHILIKLSAAFLLALLLASLLAACGGGSGNPSTGSGSGYVASPVTNQAKFCAAPRPAGAINPETKQPYGDQQGTLTDEMAWIASYVNQTYLWYADVPSVGSAPYFVGATVPYVEPATNTASTKHLTSNYMVVDAYFNSQRSGLFTASGKPKDQFHFTYTTAEWQALSAQGTQGGFGFEVALLAASPPRQAVVAYVAPGSPAAQKGIVRGTQFISVNGVSVSSGTDLTTLNNGLFSPVAGTAYTFVVQIPGAAAPSTITMTPTTIKLTPVLNAQTLPAPNTTVGYILYNDQIATAESELAEWPPDSSEGQTINLS